MKPNQVFRWRGVTLIRTNHLGEIYVENGVTREELAECLLEHIRFHDQMIEQHRHELLTMASHED